ncbi:uncharacterized protein LOC130896056 [Diorhabda carinulata]|uniref:uncharacterized protein LOC130896056 n=1 Tax=Diorhabda carinulata TaxID=1163345 RepID=UPI0025A07344|nr:uncharacterized protein LOC130896056 [Diorhabda carinulata]XP_057659817.1 uncharacterized protein LOC130896056 [Diorhabda carinulata]XP_057659818.1 uncharacterized protein LOC130896056 [Diorhabda carinulata]XP_057659820.1 uncharacterized protein LOC130896056 [Diorhabda carinulata]
MGCGHSKINIYPRKSKNKNNSKKSADTEKVETEEEECVEAETENTEDVEENGQKRTIKFKPIGGPLLAQTEISTSQQDFFKMLDDKIENGPDYDSDSESEKAREEARLRALLNDWETASAGSRSVTSTPKKRPAVVRDSAARDVAFTPRIPTERVYVSQIPASVIHQSYGVRPPYRQATFLNANYATQSPSHQMAYPSAMQYQALSPLYTNQSPQSRQFPPSARGYSNNSPKQIPYEQSMIFSPNHKMYALPVPQLGIKGQRTINEQSSDVGYKPSFKNGDLVQPHVYSQQSVQYQQYKEAREQVLAQNQQQQHPVVYRGPSKNYQSSVTIPIVVKSGQTSDMNVLHRKQYELT